MVIDSFSTDQSREHWGGDKSVSKVLTIRPFQTDRLENYLWIFVFCIPDVGAGTHAVVGVVARRLVYPLPAQVFPEIDVQAPHTASLSLAASQTTREEVQSTAGYKMTGTDTFYTALA